MWSGRRPRKHSGCRDPSKTCEAATNCLLITTPKVAKKWRLASRVVYIGGATLLTCAILLEGIFVRLLLVPYLREADFKPTLCVLHNTFYEVRAGLQRCESRCAKLASAFPCLVVRVRFLQPHDRSWHTGYLFDQLLSYQKRQPHFCSIRPCHLHKDRNTMLVSSFNWSLSHARVFPCYLRGDAVILNKLRSFSTTWHALLWPAFTAILSAFFLLLSWRLTGCRVWRDFKSSENMTTSNSKPYATVVTSTSIISTATASAANVNTATTS
ncbi:hypothetical protein ECG_03136 [Echinococcus granulosus]|nr:hypothetical protein ECG_03136 [Echinococcus granulosus]